MDDSALLDLEGIRKYQTVIGILQWASVIGRLDITHAVSSLSRFSAAPRQGHLDLVVRVVGYLKKFPNKRSYINPAPLIMNPDRVKEFKADFSDEYRDSAEEKDLTLPKSYGEQLQTSVFFNSDHAHDLVSRRSISGIIAFVGSTPVVWISRRQGAIASSTYSAEFSAMRAAVEEAQSIRHMLRCLGVPVDSPTKLFGDNLGVIQNAGEPDADLKKKHVAISFHLVREAVAAGIVTPYWIDTNSNFADILTKQIPSVPFLGHVMSLLD